MRKWAVQSEVKRKNKIKQKNKKQQKKKTKNLIKMIMEALTVMMTWHHNTMKVGKNSKSAYVEKNQGK